LRDAVGHTAHTVVASKVSREHLDMYAVLQRQLIGKRFKPRRVARDDDQVVPAGREPLCKDAADASGGAGDECDLTR
jgi:hypothetical protein